MPTNVRCETCHYLTGYRFTGSPNTPSSGLTLTNYECRRYPKPIPVNSHHWCGEWKPVITTPENYIYVQEAPPTSD